MSAEKKKCPDCDQCQMCSENRCRQCRAGKHQEHPPELGPLITHGEYMEWKKRKCCKQPHCKDIDPCE